MDGSDDFRPEAEQRASDPSLADMLRRAREAPLGGARQDTIGRAEPAHLTPRLTGARWSAPALWLHSCAVLVLGILLGVLATTATVQAGLMGSWRQAPAATQTVPISASQSPAADPPPPTAAPPDASWPTATPNPRLALLGVGDVVALARDFYDYQSPYAGVYVLRDVTGLAIQRPEPAQLTVCMAYEYAPITAPDAVAGTDTRLFTLRQASDGTWRLLGMGGSGSCSLN